MLEVDGVMAGYGRLVVVKQLKLAIPERSVVGLLGANGAGKTTTVNAIACVLPIMAGEIRLAGRRIDGRRADEVCKLGISLVPQARELFPYMSVYENLEIAAIAKHGARGSRDRVDIMLERFPRLKERLRLRASSLSGGEQQMLVIARALMAEPRLLILDEPTTGLAPLVVNYLAQVISGLVEAGQTILLVEQNIALVKALAQTVHVMRKGEIVFTGNASDLSANSEISSYYLQ